MADPQKFLFKIFGFFLVLGLLIPLGQPSYAGLGKQPAYRSHRPYTQDGKDEIVLPTKFVSIVIDGSQYYYCDGVFYRRGLYKYVVVEPPVGAVVPALPLGYETIKINNMTYYRYQGVYYQLVIPAGYAVVPPPASQNTLPK